MKPKRVTVPATGEIFQADSILMQSHAGKATDRKKRYRLGTAIGGTPIVQSVKTRKSFHIPWESVIHAAQSAGIDD